MVQSIVSAQNGKPAKPHKDFPLFAHATKRWAKKVRGKLRYFGPWAEPDAALNKWLDQKDDLLAGRTPGNGEGLSVRDGVNHFLTSKARQRDSGDLAPRTFAEYHDCCQRIVKAFGLTRLVSDLKADDFEKLRVEIAKTRGPVSLGNEIQRVRTVFKYLFDADLIARPVKFGPVFKKPSRKTMRKARANRGKRMFDAADILKMLKAAGPQMRAMILLAVNGGFGNNDVGMLPRSAVNLATGWIEFARPQTGIPRRIPLWPETTRALHAVFAKRPAAKEAANESLVFITKYGEPWSKETRDNPVSREFVKLLKKLNLHRIGLGFYGLRRTFRTTADAVHDQPAIDSLMGHAADESDMPTRYRERIGDDRLQAVVDHVRSWLFGKPKRDKIRSTTDPVQPGRIRGF